MDSTIFASILALAGLAILLSFRLKKAKALGIAALVAVAAIFALYQTGCAAIWPGWAVDYGRSKAVFTALQAPVEAPKYKRSRVTIEGKVTRIEQPHPGEQRIWLDDRVQCDRFLGSTQVGKTIRVNGVVASADDGKVVLRPTAQAEVASSPR
jgi:hypothetical protein